MLARFLACVLAICSFALNAQAPAKKPARVLKLEAGRVTSIAYGSSPWNKDSTKIDSAFLIMRDKASGRLVQIQLEETEPDSSSFTGQFSVDLGEAGKTTPEIFIPPQNLDSERDFKKIHGLIQSNKLARKPVIWKTDQKGQAMLDVYDTREQAAAALAAFQEAKKLEQKPIRSAKPIVSETAIAAAKQAEHQAALAKLAAEAAQRESDRVRLEQIERQKAAERLKEAQALTEKARAENRARAEQLEAEALAHYGRGEFVEAEAKFKESVQLDPENTSLYFRYGITLYRNSKWNDALVILKLAKVDAKFENERRYFMGLTYYRLAELDPALESFGPVAKSGDPVLGPSSLFYMGVVYFSQQKFAEAKTSFETVIDTSNDPRLDEQAEAYLDRLASAIAFQKLQENKFTLTGTVGLSYDSNVLLSPDNTSDQGSATDSADARLLTSGDLEYRPILNEHHEFSAKVNANLTNSAKNESAVADPFIYGLTLPYSYKGVVGKKGVKFTVKPGYELLYMDPTDTGTKTNILSSYFVAFEPTFIINPKWFSTYSLDYRIDDAKTADSTGINDLDATKVSLKTSQTLFLDKSRKEALIASVGYVMNTAKGDNKKYDRIEAGVMYVRPTKWEASWISGLSLYQLKYPDADEVRKDFNTTLLTGISKPIRDWVTWGLMGTYTKNDSNISSNEYSRWMVLTTATFVTNF